MSGITEAEYQAHIVKLERALADAKKRIDDLFAQAQHYQALHASVVQLWDQLQTVHGQLQDDYRRLSIAHGEILLAHGALLREHRQALPTGPSSPAMPTKQEGDSGIEFGPDECRRDGCPTQGPHRHLSNGAPELDAIITARRARIQATLDDERSQVGSPDSVVAKANPNVLIPDNPANPATIYDEPPSGCAPVKTDIPNGMEKSHQAFLDRQSKENSNG